MVLDGLLLQHRLVILIIGAKTLAAFVVTASFDEKFRELQISLLVN